MDKRIQQLIADHLAVPLAQVEFEARLVDDLGADSLDTVDLVEAINDEFHIAIKVELMEPVETVGDLIALVHSQR